VLSILAALVRRSLGGDAQYLDVAAAEGVISLMSLSIDQFLASGEVAGPRQVLLTGRYAFYDVYRCGDDKWVSVGAIEPHFYRNLCRLLGLDRWADHQMDDSCQDEIRQAFREAFLERNRDEWVAELAPQNTCVAPVYEIPELVDDPHFVERGVFMEAEDPENGCFRQVAPILAGGIREQPKWQVRSPNESDAQNLLEEVGYGVDEIEELRRTGAVD
jgi:alpha-methylacyl-CoA racemase